MKFEFKGAVGWILHDAAVVDYSFVSVGMTIPPHSGVPNDFAVRWMQISFFLFGVGMPLALLLALLVLWVFPMSISRQRQLFVLAEVLNAWSTLDVYSISILAALLEIQQFAAFIVGDSCDGINQLLENFDEALDGDDKCFDVVALLLDNAWIIFTAAVLIILVGIPSLAICNIAIHTRMKQTEEELNEHIRGRSGVASITSDSAKQYIPNSDSDVCKPLLNHGQSSPSGFDINNNNSNEAPANNNDTAVQRKGFFSQLNSHNFNLLLIRCLAVTNLVTITSVDTNLAFYKHQLALQQQQQSDACMSSGAGDYTAANNENISTNVY